MTELLGCDHPILQTGMGWVAEPPLVAAACNAGAFGFLAAATIPPEEVEGAIEEIKARTDRPFGVNFLMDAPGADVISDAIIRQGVRAAGYNRAPSAELIGKMKEAGVVCVPTCGAVKHAAKAQQLGADIIIAQGGEGGGHTGSTPTSLLAASCADAVDVPVVAAGGFRDGRGLVAALAFGAEGVAMGTRFLMTSESPLPPQSFELLRSGLAMRKNQGLSLWQTIMAANAPILARVGVADGDPVNGYLASGTVAGVIDDRPTCDELVRRIVEEAEQTLKRLAL